MKDSPTTPIDVADLRIGMFVHLDLGWMDHPFPLSSFKISSQQQIDTIRSLGLKTVRYAADKSDAPEAADTPAPTVVEEDDVARLQLGTRNQRRIQVDHLAGRARQLDAGLFAEQVTDETAAIKTGFGRGAARTVTGTDQFEAAIKNTVRQRRQLVGLLIGQLGDLGGRRFRQLYRCSLHSNRMVHCMARTSGQECCKCQWHEGCEAFEHGHGRVFSY